MAKSHFQFQKRQKELEKKKKKEEKRQRKLEKKAEQNGETEDTVKEGDGEAIESDLVNNASVVSE